MLENIVETIMEIITSELRRKSALFVIKKVISQAGILGKSVRILKISSKNGFLEDLISKQANTLQNIKRWIMKKMMIKKVLMM